MAECNLGRVAFFDRGVFSLTETYNKWDFVVTSDSTYLFIGETPQIGNPVTDTLFWKCIANGKPATLAAAAAEVATQAANTAAQNAIETEAAIEQAENLRVTAESVRSTAESTRLSNENTRQSNETGRVSTESARVTAENTRVAAENTRGTNEIGRVSAESARVSAETTRGTNEATRQSNETGRVSAEAARVTAESARNIPANAYNLTVQVPLGSGYYTLSTAVAAVVVGLRKKGLTITFESAANVWETYQFTGTSTATWSTLAQWIKYVNYPNVTELLELPLSEALNVLYAKIQVIEVFVKASQYGNITADQVDVVRNFNIWGKTNLIIEGTAAPAIVPDFIGQTFINTAVGVTYTAKGISSVADWKQTSN